MKLTITQHCDTLRLAITRNTTGYPLDFQPAAIHRNILLASVVPHIPADWFTTIKQLHDAELAAIAARVNFIRSIKTEFRDSIAPPLVSQFKRDYPELFI